MSVRDPGERVGPDPTPPDSLAEAGLGAVLDRCPIFAAWWEDLLS
ncbi:hypothetical protein QU670_14560 [Actinomyces massiliensis]|uniref:Uncharacterized protein n=1 Tax=Actinomyces massiliensis F0489 TaxID=1125718 RepID=J1H0Y8_9ACTO|nr:hypothetical protein [Actinomyces massiliensis]EJF39080.1 hypothetical protein HMPREF1318_2740 [Actinomyces massiliensis F0489]WLD71641.1 hypothetical protein QU670_14560 [Actinomyces massiliensis]